MTNIYGELDSGLTFWLNPDYIKGWEQDEKDCLKKSEQEDAGATSGRGEAENEAPGQV